MKKCEICNVIQHPTKDYFPSVKYHCKHCYKSKQKLLIEDLISTKGRNGEYSEGDLKLVLEYKDDRLKKKAKAKTKGLKNKIRYRLKHFYGKIYCAKCNKWHNVNDLPLYLFKKNTNWCAPCHKKYNYNFISARIKTRLKEDSFFKFEMSVRQLIGMSIRNKGYSKKSKTQQILGCDFKTFKAHIEKQFKNGMTWENRSEWHIDHIYPLKEAKTEEDVIRLNHYTNLRPLWAKDNLLKNAKIEEHQMKLPI